MARTPALVATIKRELKTRGISYRQLGQDLDLSESAIKQMFSSGNMSLRRLDAIGEVLGLDASDLMSLTDATERKLEQLSTEQEHELVEDVRFLVVSYCALNHWTFEEILRQYDVSEPECIAYLARLDRMKVIELQPGNRIKLLIANNFAWQPDGPIEAFFRQQVLGQFFHSRFTSDGELRLVKNGDMSRSAQKQIADRLIAIGELFDNLTFEERKLPFDERHGTTMVLAIRQWQFTAFRKFERADAVSR